MRMRTTHLFSLLGLLLLTVGQAHAQIDEMVKAKPVATKEEKAIKALKDQPIILGLPTFIMNTATSLRMEPDHRSGVQIRLRPGMRVEVLDPHSYYYWTKIRVGERVGWAKKHCMDPESGEFDFLRVLGEVRSEL